MVAKTLRFPAAAGVLLALAAVAPPVLASGGDAATQAGAAIYRRHCAACHGEKGDARSRARQALASPPRDFTAPDVRRELTREYMIVIVREGRPHKAMVGRKARLSEEQIESVVDYIRAAFMPP